MSQRDFRAIECWIFDLDNTLYPPSANLFGQIDTRMVQFICEALGVDAVEADRLRRLYWREHGTTLAGLIRHHGVDAEAFLSEAHAIDYSGLAHDAGLAEAIAALPGRRLIHTNGPRCHAEAVLGALGYGDLFDGVYALEDAGLVSKPQADAFHAVYQAAGVDPSVSAMIEDDPRNLAVPHALSLRTIWLDHGEAGSAPDHVHHHIDDLTAFLRDLV